MKPCARRCWRDAILPTQDNAATQPVAIVNQAFVDRYWPGQNAIGKRIQVDRRSWYTVVGVAANGKYRRLIYDPAPLVLLPLMQRYESLVILHVRTARRSAWHCARPSSRRSTASIADLPLFNVTTLKTNMQMGSVFERIAVVFAGLVRIAGPASGRGWHLWRGCLHHAAAHA